VRARYRPSFPFCAPPLSSGFGRLLSFAFLSDFLYLLFNPARLDARLHDDGIGVVTGEIEAVERAGNTGAFLVLAGLVIADQIVGGATGQVFQGLDLM